MPIPNNNWTNLFKEGNIFKEGFKNDVTPLDDYNLNQVLNGIILNKDSIESINKAAFGNGPIPSSGDSLQTQINANKNRLDELDTTYATDQQLTDAINNEASIRKNKDDELAGRIEQLNTNLQSLDFNVIEINGGGVPTKNLDTWNGEYGDNWGNI